MVNRCFGAVASHIMATLAIGLGEGSAVERGSLWRKWDLHVHSPASVLNNDFPKHNGRPDWDAYIARLEQLTDIAVIAVTDYYSIDGYRKIREYQEAGRLQNVQLFLPNIEFRLDKIVASRKLNYHVIFSDDVAPDDIEHHFLHHLKFYTVGSPDLESEAWYLTRYELEQLGARLKQQQPSFQGRSDFEIGCLNAYVDANQLKEVLANKRSVFNDRYLIVLAEENQSRLQWDGQDHLIRKTLVQGAHAIFSSSEGTRAWGLGERHMDAQEFCAEFQTLKPCIHGSDAHRLDRIGNPANNRFCWIKADTTFEGLRQILFEPEDRVHIGDVPPGAKNAYNIIDRVVIGNSPGWFGDLNVPLNMNLACIIGGRGSGKSALAELIAYAGGAYIQEKDKDTFLQRASAYSETNEIPVTDTSITLHWKNGETTVGVVDSSLSHRVEEPKVRYLPQKFVERLCDPNNNTQIEQEIENVIFQRLAEHQQLGTSNFRELRKTKTQPLKIRQRNLEMAISRLNQSIYDDEKHLGQKPDKEKELRSKMAELEQLGRSAPAVPQASPEDLKELDRLQAQKRELDGRLTALNEQINILDTLKARVQIFSREIEAYNSEIQDLLRRTEMENSAGAFKITTSPRMEELISARHLELEVQMRTLREGDLAAPATESVTSLAFAINAVRERLKLSDTLRIEFEKHQSEKRKLETTIAAVTAEIKEIDGIVIPRLKSQRIERSQRYLELWDVLLEERAALEDLYQPLRDALASGSATGQKLQFFSRITFDASSHAQQGLELIDARKRAAFRSETQLEEALNTAFSTMQERKFDRQGISDAMRDLRSRFGREDNGQAVEISDQLRQKKTVRDFDDWFYSVAAFRVAYSLKFDGKELHLLSPGQKGIVLVLVYLEIDEDDTRPLIIDQPDDNLDSQSVYENLIDYFRKRKESRQIIMITHNPNLVVNTDAEQIIVATYDGSTHPRIRYFGGALENVGASNQMGVRELACAVLEGGTDAFRRREEKYALK